MNDDIFDAVEELLDAERNAIIDGRVEDLEAMLPLKSALQKRLANAQLDPRGDLPRLREKSAHNQRLMAASAKGIKAAQARINQIRRGESDLRTYGGDGTCVALPDSGGAHLRKHA